MVPVLSFTHSLNTVWVMTADYHKLLVVVVGSQQFSLLCLNDCSTAYPYPYVHKLQFASSVPESRNTSRGFLFESLLKY